MSFGATLVIAVTLDAVFQGGYDGRNSRPEDSFTLDVKH
jgi:hypothetical protein